jgi:hypothetical protein
MKIKIWDMMPLVVWYIFTNISKGPATSSILNLEESCTMKIKPADYSNTLIHFYHTVHQRRQQPSLSQLWEPKMSCGLVFFVVVVSLGGVRLSLLGTSATAVLLYQPRMIDDDDYGAVGGMRIGRGNRSTRRKPAPVPLCPPQIPHDLSWDRTRAAAVGSQRLTTWAMARPGLVLLQKHCDGLAFISGALFVIRLRKWRQNDRHCKSFTIVD